MSIEKIDISILDSLTSLAKRDPRLRQNCDLRNSPEDQSQRMLNAIEPGSEVPIHRHRASSETVVCIRGRLLEMFYDEEGRLTHSIELSPLGPVVAYNIPNWTVALSSLIREWYCNNGSKRRLIRAA